MLSGQRPSTLYTNESQAIHVLDNRCLSSLMASEIMAIDMGDVQCLGLLVEYFACASEVSGGLTARSALSAGLSLLSHCSC